MKIRTTFILALTFFSLSSIIAYTVYSSISMGQIAEKQYESLYTDIANGEAELVTDYVESLIEKANAVADDSTLMSFTADNSASAIEKAGTYIGDETGISRIALLNGGNLVASTENGYSLTFTADEISKMTSSNSDVYVSRILDAEGKPADYELATLVSSDGKQIIVYFNKNKFDSIIKAGLFPTNGRVVFVDGLDNIIDSTYIGLISENDRGEYSVIGKAKNDSQLNTPVRFEIGRTQRIAYMVKALQCGWCVTTLAEADQAYKYSSSAFGTLLGTVVGVSVLFIVLYVIIIVAITKPLHKIENTLTMVHRGDHESRIEINSKNEYGEISAAFNRLIDNVVVSERRYRTIVEMADDIVFEWNLKTNNITFSNNFNKKFSFRAASDHFSDSFFMKGKVHPEDNERYRNDLAKLEQGVDFKNNQYRWKNIYGDYIWMSVTTSTIRDTDNNIVKIIGVLSDVDRAKKGEMQLRKQASYDALTGVYNRETIENVIENEIQGVADGNDGFAILFVDIDDFKIYNDLYSHAIGDQVLKFLTDSVSEIIQEYGFIGRYGGDEFIVCIRNISTNNPQRVAQDILTKLKAGFVCDSGARLSISVSIGIHLVKNNSKGVDEIISIADDAMYSIKKNGKSNFIVVSDENS